MSIYLDTELRNTIERAAELQKVSVSELIREIFRDWQQKEHLRLMSRIAKAGLLPSVLQKLQQGEKEAINGAD